MTALQLFARDEEKGTSSPCRSVLMLTVMWSFYDASTAKLYVPSFRVFLGRAVSVRSPITAISELLRDTLLLESTIGTGSQAHAGFRESPGVRGNSSQSQ